MAILSVNLINGEKPEFGNPKHIAFIKEQQRLSELKENGFVETKSWIDERPKYELSLTWNCFKCNEKNKNYLESDDKEFADETINCKNCNAEYEIDGDYNLQLIHH